MSNNPFDTIMQLSANTDIKECVKRWERLSINLQKTGKALPINLPNMLWRSRSGVGQTTMLRYLAEYLKSRKLIDFKGKADFIEFSLEDDGITERFDELVRLDKALSSMAGLHDQFRGIVVIDVTDWIHKLDDSRFASFLEYLQSHDSEWLIILTANCPEEDDLNELYAYIHSFIRVDLIHTSFPEIDEAKAYLTRKMREAGFELTPEAAEVLMKSVDVMSKTEIYDGYHTLRLLSQEIIYYILTTQEDVSLTITPDDISYFALGSDYMKLYQQSEDTRKRIGF